MPRVQRGRPRIVFFNPSLYAIGGMQAWLATLMPDLVSCGWDVWLALPEGQHNDASAYLENYPFHPCLRVVNRTQTRLGRTRALQRAIEPVRPDLLVVAHLVSAYPAVADLRARGLPAPRLVASYHAQSPGMFADLGRYRSVIDAVVAPNRLLVAASSQIGTIAPERVFHGPYGIDVPSSEPVVPDQRALELVFAHRLEDQQKRLRDLPRLVEELERRGVDFSLEVVGAGPDGGLLREWLADPVQRGRVRFVGPVLPSELRQRALRPGRVLLVTSSWENGPIVALQAMAWGCAVVSSRYVGSRSEGLLRDGENALLFDVGDVEAAADCIARLRDGSLLRRLVAAAWRSVRERYSRAVSGETWNCVLRQILELPDLPRPDKPPVVAPAGRLDRWLGVEFADRVRSLARLPVPVSGPGDEWPHTEGGGVTEAELFEALKQLDRHDPHLAARRAEGDS